MTVARKRTVGRKSKPIGSHVWFPESENPLVDPLYVTGSATYLKSGYVLTDEEAAYSEAFEKFGKGVMDYSNWLAQQLGIASGKTTWVNDRYALFGNGYLCTSIDGLVWTPYLRVSTKSTNTKIVYGNGIYLAVNGIGDETYTSTDAVTWVTDTSISAFGTTTVRDVVFTGSEFMLVRDSLAVLASVDGKTWGQRTVAPAGVSYAIGANAGVIVAVGATANKRSIDNGATWETASSSETLYCLAYGNGKWVSAGLNGNLAVSTDGLAWTLKAKPFGTTNIINGVVFANGFWVATNTGGRIATSTDLETWTIQVSGGFGVLGLIAANGTSIVTAPTINKVFTATSSPILGLQTKETLGNTTKYVRVK